MFLELVRMFQSRDRSAHKKEAIRKGEKKYHTLFETSIDAMLIIDGDQFVDCNAATVAMLGYDHKADLLNVHPSELSPEFQADGRSSFEKANEMMAIARENGGHRFQWTHLKKDGEEIPMEVSLTAIKSQKGVQLHAVWRDLTHRIASERALVESEQQLAAILRAAPVGIGVVKDQVLVGVNPYICALTGYRREELEGQRARMLYLTEEDFIWAEEQMNQQITGKGSGAVEIQWCGKDGRAIDVLFSSTPMNVNDPFAGTTFTVLDINESRRVRAALRNSEEKYRGLIESSSDWIWEVDENEMFSYVSPQVEAILGYTPEELIGTSLFDLMAPDEAERVRGIFQKTKQNSTPMTRMKNVNLHKDGYEVLLESNGVPVLNEEGRAVGYRGVDRDITEREKSEHDLTATTQRLALHVKQTPLAVIEWNMDFYVVEWNPAAEEIFGYSREEALGQHAKFIILETYHAQIDDVWQGLLSQTGGGRVTTENITKDGRPIFCEWYNTSLIDDEGNVIGAASQVMDVTARKQAEEEHARLMQAIEQVEEIIMITDAEANLQYVNPAFVQVTGYGREEAIGQNPRILKSGEHAPEFYQKMWKTLAAGKPWSGKLTNKRKDGEIYTEEATISPVIDKHGNIVNYVAAKRDITRDLELQNQFRQAQKMEAVGQMAGGVAHDFNNLLQVISGYAELFEMDLEADSAQAPAIREIGKAAKRGKGLVSQLLAFSRRQMIKPQDTNLNDVIDPLLKMMRGLIGEEIELDFIAGSELGTIHVDRGMIDQVMMNLCVNARDAMSENGKLTIETKSVTLDSDYADTHAWATPGDYVLLRVTDTGSGMSRETQEKIFEPFFTTKEVGKGTGLGLSTVFGIIQQHDGHIEIDSKQGEGTTFTIYLPTVARDITEASRKAAGAVTGGGNETLLIAEDDETVLTLVEYLLTDAGYTVHTAKNGEEAVAVFEQHIDEIDAVMFDVVMPRLNGKQALDRILELRPGIRSLFASGYSADAAQTNFIQKRGLNLLNKPYQTETLLKAIRDVLDEK